MSQPDSPEGRPLTRRELRERQERARAAQSEPAAQREPATESAAAAPSPSVRRTDAPAENAPAPQSAPPAQNAPAPQSAARPHDAPTPQGTPESQETAGTVQTATGTRFAPEGDGSAEPTLQELLTPPSSAVVGGPKKRRGGAIVILLVILALIAALVVGGWWAVNTYGDRVAQFFGMDSEPVDYEEGLATGEAIITISQGDTGWEVSQALYEADVTLTESVFYDMLVQMQKNPDFRPGAYQLQQKMTAGAALTALEDPDSRLPGIAYPEGYTIEQIVPVMVSVLDASESEVRDALEDPSQYGVDADSLEGWLFPASYEFPPDENVTDVIQGMVDRTRAALDEAGVADSEAQRILTIASIIEREARAEDDFYRVSRVIQNRLSADMRLQMDSTAQYGYGEMHDGGVFSSEEALDDQNPWNTYVHTGLPQGPIANPGQLAIDAAANPVDGEWLYFTTVDLASGETKFAVTLAEHEENVAELQQWCADNPDSTGCG